MYSLESEALLPSKYKRLDTLGMKVLCSILKLLSAPCSHITGELVAVRPLSHVVKSRRFQLVTIFVTARCLPGVFQAWFPHLPLLFLFSEARIHAERKRPSSLRFTNLTLPDLRLGNTRMLSVACGPRHCLCPRDRLGIAESHVLRTFRDRANDRAAYRRDTLQVLWRVFDRILIFLCVFAHHAQIPLEEED